MVDICQRRFCSFLLYLCVFGTLPVSRKLRRLFTVKITNALLSTLGVSLYLPGGNRFLFQSSLVYRYSGLVFFPGPGLSFPADFGFILLFARHFPMPTACSSINIRSLVFICILFMQFRTKKPAPRNGGRVCTSYNARNSFQYWICRRACSSVRPSAAMRSSGSVPEKRQITQLPSANQILQPSLRSIRSIAPVKLGNL